MLLRRCVHVVRWAYHQMEFKAVAIGYKASAQCRTRACRDPRCPYYHDWEYSFYKDPAWRAWKLCQCLEKQIFGHGAFFDMASLVRDGWVKPDVMPILTVEGRTQGVKTSQTPGGKVSGIWGAMSSANGDRPFFGVQVHSRPTSLGGVRSVCPCAFCVAQPLGSCQKDRNSNGLGRYVLPRKRWARRSCSRCVLGLVE